MPAITPSEMEALLAKLFEIGARDLKTVRQEGAITLEDLKDVVPVSIARVLLKKWTEEGALQMVSSTEEQEAPIQRHSGAHRGRQPGARHIRPEIDFDDLGMKTLLTSKNISPKDKRKIMGAASDQIIRNYGLKTNLHVDSWIFVAQQLAEKNAIFFNPKLLKKEG